MTFSFNLISEPWIPVLFAGESQPRDISLHEVLARAPDITELVHPSPLVTVALHRLLLAVCHRIYGPESEDTWGQLWNAGRFDNELLGAYFDAWRHRFDLFDEERPFYQTPGLPEAIATTIAKLAAINKLLTGLDVGLISADTYRIGAIDQLRTFAGIADIPMEVVYKPSDMSAALRKFRGKDMVFVDTVGRSQRSKKDLHDLAKFVSAADPDETHLVLNASTNVKTCEEIIDQFTVVKPNRLIFSKLDEAASYGPMLSIIHRHQLPLSYVTTGQAVPDDIRRVEASQLAAMVYTGEMAHA